MTVKNTLMLLFFNVIILLLCRVAIAQENTSLPTTEKTTVSQKAEQSENTSPEKTVLRNQNPEVGKHVMSNMDSGSMIISLMMVLALIIISAYGLKKFKLVQQGGGHLKVVASLSLGAKERVIVIQSGEKQLMLGVTPGNITLIEHLETPLESAKPELSGTVFSFLKKSNKMKE